MNLDFEDIPSKAQVFGKVDTRIKYFRKLIEDILRYAQNYGQEKESIRIKLLKILYNLLLTDATPVKTLISDKLNNTTSTSIVADDQTIDEYVDVDQEKEEQKDSGA